MNSLRKFIRVDTGDNELLLSTSRKVIGTTGVVYLVWHFVATLGWPQIFSPDLWACTIQILLTLTLTLRLLERFFFLAHAVWFAGLTLAIFTAYSIYRQPDILFLLALFPMMAEVMLGLPATIFIEIGVILFAAFSVHFPAPLAVPEGYAGALVLLSLATTFLGWGLSDNLISAIETSSYHYREALKRLEETRQHRAEISVLLKEVSKANYQLDRLNKMLTYARAKAEEAREERDRFALAVSHELRSPLNFVIGFSDLMVNSPETYAPLDAWPVGLYDDIQEIFKSSNHLLGLINDILDMGKIDAQQMPLFKERVTIENIVGEVHQMALPAAEKKGLYLICDLRPGLPELYVDRTRIRQVLLNLVSNSLRFTAKGGITVRAGLQTPDELLVEVEDTGQGISEEDLPKIFSEFHQVGSPNWRTGEGTGLGLAIGKRFIQMHGGEMGVRSQLGRGSVFYFTVPIHPEDELEIWNSGITETRPIRPSAEQSPLLLFLSGDQFWAKTFAESLEGYKVTLLADPEQLAAVAAQVFPRALIVDQALWGHAAVQAFIEQPPYDLPVISFAIPVNLNRVTALPEGVSNYLLKPVSRHTLVETVRSLGPDVHTLLVVDDDPGMVRFVTQSLRSAEDGEGLPEPELLTALTGAQALRCLQEEHVDAVLLDLDLPDINGLVLIEQMHRDQRLCAVPVVVLSANDLPQSLTIQQRGLFRITINRPLQRKELVDVLEAVLQNVTPTYKE